MRTKAEVLQGMNLVEFNLRCQGDFKFFSVRLLGITDCGGIQPYMIEWFELIRDNDRVMIQAPSGFGKCLPKDIRIKTDCGFKTVEEIKSGDFIFSSNDRLKIVPDIVVAKESNGIKKIFKIKTRTGREIKLTSNHPLLEINGWKNIDEGLKIGDFVAIPRISLNTKNIGMADCEIKLLAYMISEGSCSQSRFSNKDEKVISDFNQALYAYNGNKLNKISDKSKINFDYYVPKINPFLKKYNLFNTLSNNKFIPKDIFKLPLNKIKLFLNRLWECDGTICMSGGKKKYPYIGYGTTSKQLALDVQQLLLYFGINSKLKKRFYKNFHHYEIRVEDRKSSIKFLDIIGTFNKKEKLIQCLNYFNRTQENTNCDIIPGNFVRNNLKNTPWDLRKLGIRVDNKRDYSREFIERLAEFDTNEIFYDLATSDVYWDKIECIEFVGEEETFDIQVLNNYNFIANDFITHNTTIFEAIALWFVWNNYNKKVMIIANTDKRAITIVDDINRFIGENELINELKPKEYRETWNKTELRTTTNCRIFCKPYTPNMRGERSDFTLVDEADAEAYRDIKIFKEHVLTRLNPRAKCALISTPDSTTGLMSYLINTDDEKVWVFKKYFAIIKMKVKGDYSTGESLWEGRWTLQYLLDKKKEMKDSFEKVMMCDEKAEASESLFKSKYLIKCYDTRFKFQQKSEGGLIIIGCDFGYSDFQTADDTVYVIIEKLNGFYIIRNIEVQPKGVKLPEKVNRISELFEQYKYQIDKEGNYLEPLIVCDSSSVGTDVINELRTKGLMVVDEPFSAPSRRNMFRILQNIVENRKLIIPRDRSDENCIVLTNLMVEQLLGFIEKKTLGDAYKNKILASTAPHDDIAAALAMAIKEGTKQITGDFFGEDKDKNFRKFNQLDLDKKVEWDWNKLNK